MATRLSEYALATPTWFPTQPQFGCTPDTLRDALTPRVTPLARVRAHMLMQEAVWYALAAATLARAARRREVAIWLGLALLGAALEAVGVLLTHEHMHPRYAVMLGFLPLKEALWYPFTIYTSWVAASFVGLRDPVAEALLTALVQTVNVVQYESVAYRVGVQYVSFNPNFPLANVNDQITKAPWINIYANWAIAFAGAYCARAAADSPRAGAVEKAAVVGLLGLVLFCVVGMAPLNAFKALGCALEHASPLPALRDMERVQSAGEAARLFVDAYGSCARRSAVTESQVVAFVLLASGAYVAFALRSSLLSRDPDHLSRTRARWSVPDATLVVSVPTVYHLFIGMIALVVDHDGGVGAGQSLMLWLTCAVTSTAVSLFLSLGLFSWSSSPRSSFVTTMHAMAERGVVVGGEAAAAPEPIPAASADGKAKKEQ